MSARWECMYEFISQRNGHNGRRHRHGLSLSREVRQVSRHSTAPGSRLASSLQNKITGREQKNRMTLNYCQGRFSGTADMKSKITAGGSQRAPVEGMAKPRAVFCLAAEVEEKQPVTDDWKIKCRIHLQETSLHCILQSVSPTRGHCERLQFIPLASNRPTAKVESNFAGSWLLIGMAQREASAVCFNDRCIFMRISLQLG